MRAGRCEKGSGKRFPEDSLVLGWKRCLQDAGVDGSRRRLRSKERRRGWLWGAPVCRCHPWRWGNDAVPLWRMALGFSWSAGLLV